MAMMAFSKLPVSSFFRTSSSSWWDTEMHDGKRRQRVRNEKKKYNMTGKDTEIKRGRRRRKMVGTYIIVLFKVGLFDLHTLSGRSIGQDFNNGLLICA